jgi:hypothetical protein
MKKSIFNVTLSILFVGLSLFILSNSYAAQEIVIYGDDSYPPIHEHFLHGKL